MKKLSALVGAVLSLAIAFPAFAESGYGTIDSMSQGTVQVSSVKVDTSANAGVETQTGTSRGGKNASSTSGASVSGGINVAAGDVNGDGMAATNTPSGDPDFDLMIVRADVQSGSVAATSVNPASVSSRANLSGYIAAQMKQDKKISAVESASEKVSVTYKQPAKLFGVFRITLNTRVEVDRGGNVKISYPWYAFLTDANKTGVETALQSAFDASFPVNRYAEYGAVFNATAQAQVIDEVVHVLSGQLSTDASVNADVH